MHLCTDQTSVYTLIQNSFREWRQSPVLTPREKSPLTEAQRRVEPPGEPIFKSLVWLNLGKSGIIPKSPVLEADTWPLGHQCSANLTEQNQHPATLKNSHTVNYKWHEVSMQTLLSSANFKKKTKDWMNGTLIDSLNEHLSAEVTKQEEQNNAQMIHIRQTYRTSLQSSPIHNQP